VVKLGYLLGGFMLAMAVKAGIAEAVLGDCVSHNDCDGW
jgi:hypothetical protein